MTEQQQNNVVMVVEDEAVSRLSTVDLLEKAGYVTLPASTLGEARTTLMNGQADVILLDLHLADGSGVDFLAELKAHERTAQVPVVLVTALSADALPVGLERAAAILTKPPRERLLLAAVAAACGRKR